MRRGSSLLSLTRGNSRIATFYRPMMSLTSEVSTAKSQLFIYTLALTSSRSILTAALTCKNHHYRRVQPAHRTAVRGHRDRVPHLPHHRALLWWRTLRLPCVGSPKTKHELSSYIHENNAVHGDLKLENVLLGEYCRVKLGDFGFTREYERGALLDTYCGTTGESF